MKKIAALICLIALVSTSALAVVSPYDDMMGMYWDLDADIVCMAPLAAPVNLYIILTNPTIDAIAGFECGITMDAAVMPYILGVTFPSPHGIDWIDPQNIIVYFYEPIVCAEITLLATLNVGNFAGVPVDFYLHEATPASIPGNLPVILLTDDTLVQVITPWPGEKTAGQFHDCLHWITPIPTHETTWDHIKSLYR